MSGEADPGARTRRAARRLPLRAAGALGFGVFEPRLQELRFTKRRGWAVEQRLIGSEYEHPKHSVILIPAQDRASATWTSQLRLRLKPPPFPAKHRSFTPTRKVPWLGLVMRDSRK